MNGETNAAAARTAKEAGVPQARGAFRGHHDAFCAAEPRWAFSRAQVVMVNAAMPWFTPRGYADGKRAAEAAARELVSDSFGAAVLKPGGARARACSLTHGVVARALTSR